MRFNQQLINKTIDLHKWYVYSASSDYKDEEPLKLRYLHHWHTTIRFGSGRLS